MFLGRRSSGPLTLSFFRPKVLSSGTIAVPDLEPDLLLEKCADVLSEYSSWIRVKRDGTTLYFTGSPIPFWPLNPVAGFSSGYLAFEERQAGGCLIRYRLRFRYMMIWYVIGLAMFATGPFTVDMPLIMLPVGVCLLTTVFFGGTIIGRGFYVKQLRMLVGREGNKSRDAKQ